MGTNMVTIIIPVYNAEKYLPVCLDSVCGQTFKNLEIILVNDGSTDGSLKVLEERRASDPRVKIINKANGGSSSARNAGLQAAGGDFVSFVDADDYIESDMIENLVSVLVSDETTDIAQILSCEEGEDGKLIKDFGEDFDGSLSFSGIEFLRALLLHRGDSSFCTKLFRREFFEGFSFSEGRLNEDFELLVEMSEKIRKLQVCPKPGYHIILRGQSNTRGEFKQSFYENVMENAERMITMTEEKYPDLKECAIHFYLMQAMWLLVHIPSDKMTKDNTLYTRVIRKVRSCRGYILKDGYLSKKHKRNLLIFAFLPPRAVKKIFEGLKH